MTQSGPGAEAAGKGAAWPPAACPWPAATLSGTPAPAPGPTGSSGGCWLAPPSGPLLIGARFPKAASGDKGGPRSTLLCHAPGRAAPTPDWRKEPCVVDRREGPSNCTGALRGRSAKPSQGGEQEGCSRPGFLFLGVVCVQRFFIRKSPAEGHVGGMQGMGTGGRDPVGTSGEASQARCGLLSGSLLGKGSSCQHIAGRRWSGSLLLLTHPERGLSPGTMEGSHWVLRSLQLCY